MIHGEKLERPDYIYPPDEWRMVERRFHLRHLAQNETFFTTANGYFGLRGDFEEGEPVHRTGTLINGFHEAWPIVYGEEAHGFAKKGQTIVEVTNAKLIRLYIDDEPFQPQHARLLRFERVLDMRAGVLTRDLLWEKASGKRIRLRSTRLVSLVHRHLAAIFYEVTVENVDAAVVISSEAVTEHQGGVSDGDPRAARRFDDRVLEPEVHESAGRRVVLGHRTKRSGMTLACGIDHELETACHWSSETHCTPNAGKVVFSVDARAGEPIRLCKFIAYHTSRRAPVPELTSRTHRSLDRAVTHGFDALVEDQRGFVSDFWSKADVEIEGDAGIQQAMRFNLFHMMQATARAENTGVPAKGLTGHGYEGHYFWDTEIYLLPFLTYTEPRIARNLLRFRHSGLDKARERALEVNQQGALFPWRTISGDEASAFYAAGTAQYHINADIVYALKKYVDATGDEDFLFDLGAEILVETARLWVDLGFYSERHDGRFCIQGVTGPDEYNTVVDNNAYTNLMARENLRFAAYTLQRMQADEPERYAAVCDRTRLQTSEVAEWRRAAETMYVPYEGTMNIHLQDDQFLSRKAWDFENTPPDKYPLLLHFHPLVIYRHKVIKQADVVLAMFLLGHHFPPDQRRRNFDYYDPLTTGDSSLSASIQSIMAMDAGYRQKAADYARYALLMDLADVGGNAASGCHIASMGGTWMLVVYGLAGFRDWNGRFSFQPRLPRTMRRIRFRLRLRGAQLQVALENGTVRYELVEGDEVHFWHHDDELVLTPEVPRVERDAHALDEDETPAPAS